MTTRELPARAGQERLADRLLRSTAARSYDPELDIDWSAPLEPTTGRPLAWLARRSLGWLLGGRRPTLNLQIARGLALLDA
jgi:para-aminobenzoate N-oxygenase AurF